MYFPKKERTGGRVGDFFAVEVLSVPKSFEECMYVVSAYVRLMFYSIICIVEVLSRSILGRESLTTEYFEIYMASVNLHIEKAWKWGVVHWYFFHIRLHRPSSSITLSQRIRIDLTRSGRKKFGRCLCGSPSEVLFLYPYQQPPPQQQSREESKLTSDWSCCVLLLVYSRISHWIAFRPRVGEEKKDRTVLQSLHCTHCCIENQTRVSRTRSYKQIDTSSR